MLILDHLPHGAITLHQAVYCIQECTVVTNYIELFFLGSILQLVKEPFKFSHSQKIWEKCEVKPRGGAQSIVFNVRPIRTVSFNPL